MRTPSIERPYTDLNATVRRVQLQSDARFVDAVCQDTGLVVYTTPCAWRGRASGLAFDTPTDLARSAALGRARAWCARHRLIITGYAATEVPL